VTSVQQDAAGVTKTSCEDSLTSVGRNNRFLTLPSVLLNSDMGPMVGFCNSFDGAARRLNLAPVASCTSRIGFRCGPVKPGYITIGHPKNTGKRVFPRAKRFARSSDLVSQFQSSQLPVASFFPQFCTRTPGPTVSACAPRHSPDSDEEASQIRKESLY
jgi:hypothetical protein